MRADPLSAVLAGGNVGACLFYFLVFSPVSLLCGAPYVRRRQPVMGAAMLYVGGLCGGRWSRVTCQSVQSGLLVTDSEVCHQLCPWAKSSESSWG